MVQAGGDARIRRATSEFSVGGSEMFSHTVADDAAGTAPASRARSACAE